MIKYLRIVAVLLITYSPILAQPPCDTTLKEFYYAVPHMQSNPPLSIGMPYNTLIGYIAIDSACKNIRIDVASKFIHRQSDNDTLNYIMKYFYWMVDYDPIKYYNYAWNNPVVKPGIAEDLLIGHLSNAGVSRDIRYLMEGFYVLHVRINDTLIVDGVGGTLCTDLTVASANILDTIKGRVIPVVYSNSNNIGTSLENEDLYSKDRAKLMNVGVNFIFNFCNQWERGRFSGNLLNDGQGNAWLKPDTEYILFLQPRRLCRDSLNLYISICPVGSWSLSSGMFPIIDGNVQDIGNDFGLGTSIPIATFKQHLQSLINQIKYYGE